MTFYLLNSFKRHEKLIKVTHLFFSFKYQHCSAIYSKIFLSFITIRIKYAKSSKLAHRRLNIFTYMMSAKDPILFFSHSKKNKKSTKWNKFTEIIHLARFFQANKKDIILQKTALEKLVNIDSLLDFSAQQNAKCATKIQQIFFCLTNTA